MAVGAVGGVVGAGDPGGGYCIPPDGEDVVGVGADDVIGIGVSACASGGEDGGKAGAARCSDPMTVLLT